MSKNWQIFAGVAIGALLIYFLWTWLRKEETAVEKKMQAATPPTSSILLVDAPDAGNLPAAVGDAQTKMDALTIKGNDGAPDFAS